MVFSILSSQNFTLLSSSKSLKHLHFPRPSPHLNSFLRFNNNKREFPLPSVASSSSVPYNQPTNVEYFQKEFSCHGVTFQDIGDTCIVKLELDSGSMTTLMLPSGLITSYKVPVWHGGKVELLHTMVSQDEDGSAVIEGGVSLAFVSDQTNVESSWPANNWALRNISGNSEGSIQVELISGDTDNAVEMKNVIILNEKTLTSELIVSNSSSSSVQLKGSIISHFTVSTPDATYAVGLEGSNFIKTTPVLSRFSILPKEEGENKNGFGKLFDQIVPKEISDLAGNIRRENGEEMECEERSNYKQLNKEMSRVYTSAPQNFTVIDRGRRNSVVVGREGFEEVYMFSPGSRHECYSKFSYVCIGQSALLKPITLNPGGVWRGVQHLHNPNL